MNGLCDICKNQENRDKQPCRSCPIRNSAFELDVTKLGICPTVSVKEPIDEGFFREEMSKAVPKANVISDSEITTLDICYGRNNERSSCIYANECDIKLDCTTFADCADFPCTVYVVGREKGKCLRDDKES